MGNCPWLMSNLQKKSAIWNICINSLGKESIGKAVFSMGRDRFSNWKNSPKKMREHNQGDIHRHAERRKIIYDGN